MRTIILLLDWDSTLFWRDAAEGYGRIEESTLPISAELKQRLFVYYCHFSELFFTDERPAVSDLQWRLLDEVGLGIWRQLRSELAGVYTVLFCSKEFHSSFESPEEFLAKRAEKLGRA